jgi:hypothetical protein
LFERMLGRVDRGLEQGAIEATLPGGQRRRFGGRGEGPVAVVVLHRWRALLRLATGGSAGWYEGWVAGDWSSPDPVPLFDLFMRNGRALGSVGRAGRLTNIARRFVHWSRRNHRANARRNIQFHYDLGNDFYRAWLDPSMTYSSALFAAPDEPLETAQDRKLQAILDRRPATPSWRSAAAGAPSRSALPAPGAGSTASPFRPSRSAWSSTASPKLGSTAWRCRSPTIATQPAATTPLRASRWSRQSGRNIGPPISTPSPRG